MIYIVEDDSSIRELEQYALQSNGYETTGCEDAASFWAALRSGRPDLVILDVMLPDEDGYQILAKLRADRPAPQRRSSWSRPKPARSTSSRGWTTVRTTTCASRSASWSSSPACGPCCAALPLPSPRPAASTLRFGDIVLDDVSRTVRWRRARGADLQGIRAAASVFGAPGGGPGPRAHHEGRLGHRRFTGIPAPSTCTSARCARSSARRARPSAPCARWATS